MREQKRGGFQLLLVVALALIVGSGTSLMHLSPARAMPLDSCNEFIYWNQPQYAAYGHEQDCSAGPTYYVEGDAKFCAPGSQQFTRVNNDDWLTAQPWTGGKRYYETGRSGYKGISNDCNFHYMIGAGGNPQVYPLWACSWFYFADYGVGYDYQCSYITG